MLLNWNHGRFDSYIPAVIGRLLHIEIGLIEMEFLVS